MPTSVYDLDIPALDVVGLERPEELAGISDARKSHWLARTPLGFLVTTYDDAVALLRERRLHSALSMLPQIQGVDSDAFEGGWQRSILSMEGEEHTRLRRLVAPAFTPLSVDGLRPFMREVIASLVDEVSDRRSCELVSEICAGYPIPIICELLGAPKADWKRFSDWATDIFRIFNQNLAADLPVIERARTELYDYVCHMIDDRRQHPTDDLLSTLIVIEESGDRLSTDELAMWAQAILMAGTDTTRNQLACCLALFATYPDQWSTLVSRPELAPRAVEESMRYLGAVRGTLRVAAENIEYRGVVIPEGTLLVVSLAGANRDPGAFEEPDDFDITRERGSKQVTFGSGIHHCLGAALARAELQEALGVLAQRMPELVLDGPIEWKPPTVGIWGPARLPVLVSDCND
jgi:cytochrome P450